MLKVSASLCVLTLIAFAGAAIAAQPVLSNGVQIREIQGKATKIRKPAKVDIGPEETTADKHLTPKATYHPTKHTYKGAWFANQPSLEAGEAAIAEDLHKQRCHGHPISNVTFVLSNVTHENDVFVQLYGAEVRGSYEC